MPCGQTGRFDQACSIDRVDLVALSGQHLPEIAVAPGLWPVVVGLLGVGIVHVAQGDDLKTGLGALLQLAEAHAAHAHTGEREPRIGRTASIRPDQSAGNDGKGGSRSCGTG
jgi:hypothetical protein